MYIAVVAAAASFVCVIGIVWLGIARSHRPFPFPLFHSFSPLGLFALGVAVCCDQVLNRKSGALSSKKTCPRPNSAKLSCAATAWHWQLHLLLHSRFAFAFAFALTLAFLFPRSQFSE